MSSTNLANGLILAILLLTTNGLSLAKTNSDPLQKLKHTNKAIERLQQKIENSTDKRQTLYQELKDIDTRISLKNKKIIQLNIKIDKNQLQIDKINDELNELNTELDNQYQYLAKQIQASYFLGRDNALKLILNQQSPVMMNRLLTYYQYINAYRNQLIADVINTKEAIVEKNKDLMDKQSQLLGLQQALKQSQDQLKQDQLFQQRVIKSLNTKIIKDKKSLAYYLNNKKQLESLIKQLKNNHTISKPQKAFSQMQNQLPWPTLGKVLSHYGDTNPKNQMTSNGLTILAPEGQKVTAVYPGRVVFADWLKGYGLLMIIDHGLGYMTLYAHNQALFKSAGDNVTQNELIATVGHSGGAKKNSLYFEVRLDGKPKNPLRWLT